jgi:2-polyprenyl-3-methyl-5-hydroxy-6-metoxy-1,4-benzoquinol methylase
MIRNWKQFNEKFSDGKVDQIRSIYNDLIDEYDAHDPGIVGWSNTQRQRSRFNQLIKYVNSGDRILDYGCGVGDLYRIAKRKGFIYQGVDINSNMIDKAKSKYKDANFESIEDTHDFIKYDYDWFIASGVFSNYMTEQEMISVVKPAFERAKKGLAINFLDADYADEDPDYLRGYNPKKLFNLLKQKISSNIEMIDDYLPGEDFTIIFKK